METLNLTETLMKELKLYGAHACFEARLKQAQKEKAGYEVFLNLILHDEKEYRKNARVKRLVKRACFRQNACLEGLDNAAQRGVDKTLLQDLATGRFIREGTNILIKGPTGVGKSYLATAIGNHVCRLGLSVAFFRMNALIEKLSLERAKANYLNFLKRVVNFDLLILDDFGIKELQSEQYQDLYDIIDERGDGKSLVLTTQLPAQNWNEVIGDPVSCEAITDRVVSRAITITMKGGSYRKKLTKSDPS